MGKLHALVHTWMSTDRKACTRSGVEGLKGVPGYSLYTIRLTLHLRIGDGGAVVAAGVEWSRRHVLSGLSPRTIRGTGQLQGLEAAGMCSSVPSSKCPSHHPLTFQRPP